MAGARDRGHASRNSSTIALAALRHLLRPGIVDPLCRSFRPRGAVGLGIGVGAFRLVGQVANLSYRPASNPAHERWPRLRTVLLAGLSDRAAVFARTARGAAADPFVSQPEPGRPARRRIPGRAGAGLRPGRAPGCLCRAAVGLGAGGMAGDRVGVAAGDTGTRGPANGETRRRIDADTHYRHRPSAIRHRSSPSPGPSCPSSSTTWSSVTGQLLPRATSALRCRVGCCWAGWRCAAGQDWGGGPAPLAALALVVVLAPGLRGDLFDPRFFREDTRGLVTWLKENTDPRPRSDPGGSALPLWLLLRALEQCAGRLTARRPGRPGARAISLRRHQHGRRAADRLGQGPQARLLGALVRVGHGPRGAVPFLLEKFGSLLGERSFRGYNVRGMRSRPMRASSWRRR